MTTQVDFYVLAAGNKPDLFVCRLIEKAFLQNKKIHVHAANQQHAQRLDELLWTFRDESFIPHGLYGDAITPMPAVQIGWEPTQANHQEVLLNLNNTIPDIAWESLRIIEIVTPDIKAVSREHYQIYRDKNFELKSHNIK